MSQPPSRPGSDDRTNRIGRFRSATAQPFRRVRDGLGRGAGSRCPVREDPAWAVAESVQLQERAEACCGDTLGRIAARRHPTGWFLTASCPPGLSAEERADLRHFVCVRIYLLLINGPEPGTWDRGASSGEWIADLAAVPRLDAPNVAALFGR